PRLRIRSAAWAGAFICGAIGYLWASPQHPSGSHTSPVRQEHASAAPHASPETATPAPATPAVTAPATSAPAQPAPAPATQPDRHGGAARPTCPGERHWLVRA